MTPGQTSLEKQLADQAVSEGAQAAPGFLIPGKEAAPAVRASSWGAQLLWCLKSAHGQSPCQSQTGRAQGGTAWWHSLGQAVSEVGVSELCGFWLCVWLLGF